MPSVIVSAVRTPTGKFLGALKDFTAPQLGALVVREAVARAGIDPASVDECIMGNVVSAGTGQAPARQAALKGGLADHSFEGGLEVSQELLALPFDLARAQHAAGVYTGALPRSLLESTQFEQQLVTMERFRRLVD